jgi:phage terminase large subunit
LEIYDIACHNKSENIYTINDNTIRFFSVDQEQKTRGSKRDILFLNEANEFNYDEFRQLNQRTTEMTIMDYNPSEEFHWIYEHILTRNDVKFYKTTFRDNPFLDDRIRKEILSYKDKDQNYWRIYGLGERGLSEASIFTHWKECEDYATEGQEFYGMDFGFNDPTTLVRTRYTPGRIVSEGLLYKSNLTSSSIILEMERLVSEGKLTRTSTIFADSARPEIIQDILMAGFNIQPVKKENGSVLRGINFIKRHRIDIVSSSPEFIKEIRMYKWKINKEGKLIDEPVGVNDHYLDGLRYSLDEVSSISRDSFSSAEPLDVRF